MNELYDQSNKIRALIALIENVRQKRQDTYRTIPHPERKRFSQDELRNLVPTYKNMLIRRTKRLPSRQFLIAITTYLECDLTETNDILLTADYIPENPTLHDDEHRYAVEHAKSILRALPFPAELISQSWYTEDMNEAYVKVNHSPRLAELDEYTRYSAPWFFDSQLSCQQMYAANQAVWAENKGQYISLYRHLHRMVLHEKHFKEKLDQFRTLPEFQRAWQETQTIRPSMNIKVWSVNMDTIIEEQSVIIPVSTSTFPVIVMSLPVNEAARNLYRQYNLPVDKNESIDDLLL